MKTVAQIIRSKHSPSVHTINPETSVLEAIKLMALHRIGALLVLQDEQLVGIVTERDYARKVVLLGRTSKVTPVSDVMSTPVMYVNPSQTNEECMALMTDSRIRHLPVMEHGKLIGIISIGDLVKDIISEQQFVIDQLQHYINGERG
ncbi:MAG: CBS domain-containing protein [Burkholderiales bacterium]|nr:CBS domain-containing protein [Burkholderiales bacterium]